MKRTALILAVAAAALGVAPSVASGARAQVVKPALVKPALVKPAVVRQQVVKQAIVRQAIVRQVRLSSSVAILRAL